ncbi:MAG: hypothetical protein ACOWWO_15200 [Peptococcaceae bacterium]
MILGKHKSTLLICFMIICLIIAGCTKKENPPVQEEPNSSQGEEPVKKELTVKDVYPLNAGDYWKFAGTGNEYASFEQKVLFREGDRIQLQNATGGTVMAMIYEFKDGKLMVVYSLEEFYEEENILNRENQMSEVILQEPITAGNSWESGEKKYTIEAVDVEVETPAGKFADCVKVTIESDQYNSQSFVYYKPNLGLVKQEFISDEYQITAELEDYNIKTANL